MTPLSSPIREPFDVAYETGFPLSERLRGFSSVHFGRNVDTEDRTDLTDRLSDTSSIIVPSTDFVG